MSGLAKFEVEVGADISGLQTGLNKAAGVTQAYASKVNQSFKDVAKSSNTAGQSLTNLGRIAQDAPFGFVGITNNINPLLESFQRLKVETGSTSGALKALSSSMLGGAGLGLAVSVATGLLTVLAQKGFFAVTKEADEAAEKAKKFKEEVKGIFESVGKEATQVATLITVLKQETETRQRKLQALQELKKINPEIFNGLKLEEGAVKNLDTAYTAYIENLKNVIAAKIIQSKLEKLITSLLEAQGVAATSGQKALETTFKNLNKQRSEFLQGQGFAGAAKQVDDLNTSFDRFKTEKIKNIQFEIDNLLKELGNFSKDIKLKPLDELKNKAVKIAKDLRVTFSESPIEFIDPDQLARDVEAAFAKIKNINAATITIPVDITPAANTDNLAGLKEAQMIAYLEGQGITKAMQDGINVGVRGLRFPELKALYDSTQKSVADFNAKIGQLSVEMQENILIAFGEGIGNTLANLDLKGGLGAMFAGIFGILGGGLKELGKYLIVTSKLIQAFKVAFSAFKPAGQLIAGIGLVALGALIQSKASQIPGFADGVNNFRGGLAVVGERGPELVNLPSGSNVIPNHNLNGLQGSNTIIPDVRIDGRDIVLVFNRAQKSLSITG